MILKKPYAFFIKIFKPAHIIMAILTAYLIYASNNILGFFNSYIYSNDNVVGETIRESFVTNALYIIPIVIISFSLIFLGIMFRKKKPVVFYVVIIFAYLVVMIINMYTSNFLSVMEEAIVSIRMVKLDHDLILINMIIEIISFVLLLVRGLGLNFKKFNFDSDITKLNINESDKEEIELSLNVDFEYAKRKRRRNLRYFKYIYKENKFVINSVVSLFLIMLIAVSLFFYANINKKNTEGIIYTMNKFNLRVNKSIFLNEDFNNQKITDNYLVVVNVSLQTSLRNISLFLKDFSLEVGEAVFSAQNKYAPRLIDIGISYDQNVLTQEYTDYIFVFEIPEKYIESALWFVYNDEGAKTKINLNPQNYVVNETMQTVNMTESIDFKDTLGDITFSINEFDIKKSFLIKYNYCVSKNDCVISKEYIKPTINENFDKYILKLNVDYFNDSNLDVKSFYEFFSKFVTIEYIVNGIAYNQSGGFEELRSKKVDNKNNVYIGVNSNVSNADSIKLVFNIRNSKYIYILK